MRSALTITMILAWLAGGCLESNPQPSPEQDKGGKPNGGYDGTAALDDMSTMDMAAEIVAEDLLLPDATTGEVSDTCDAGETVDSCGLTPGLAECLEKHSGCECYEGCADGFTTLVYYPAEAGEFPEEINPPAELLEAAVARYDCAVCACTEGWQVKIDGQWQEVDAQAFCEFLLQHDFECGGCLSQWTGGCC